MAFMALINPLVGLLLRCGCSSADFLEKRSVVVPFCVQGSAGVGLFSFRFQQLCVGALFSYSGQLGATACWSLLV